MDGAKLEATLNDWTPEQRQRLSVARWARWHPRFSPRGKIFGADSRRTRRAGGGRALESLCWGRSTPCRPSFRRGSCRRRARL